MYDSPGGSASGGVPFNFSTLRKGTKRKLEPDATHCKVEPAQPAASASELSNYVAILERQAQLRASASEQPDLKPVRKAVHALAEACKSEVSVDAAVSAGAVEALAQWLSIIETPSPMECGEASTSGTSEEIAKEASFLFGRLAIKPDYQNRIAASGAIPHLVALLAAQAAVPSGAACSQGSSLTSIARRVCDAITNLAHENVDIKNLVKQEKGIPPLVCLLSSPDVKVQRAAAGALRTLAFKNEQNKQQIVDCNALPVLISMLQAEDTATHYEAVGTLGNLVHSSPPIKERVLASGGLQPVIRLLSSSCPESQREAALLLGQFATVSVRAEEVEYKVRIAQRGAVPPLIEMLRSDDNQLKEMAAFAIGRLATNSDNQAGIVHLGGLRPLLGLLSSQKRTLQHNAAFALYGLADNPDNVTSIIKESAFQTLWSCDFKGQQSKDCAEKTIKRLEEKLEQNEWTLTNTMNMLRSSDSEVQQQTAVALAHLARDTRLYHIFIERRGLDVLLDMVQQVSPLELQKQATDALHSISQKVSKAGHQVAMEPNQPSKCVYLGPQFVNNPSVHDVVFNVEGRPLYAHKVALCAASEAFQCMFEGGYKEASASDAIDIPNIKWEVFEALMFFVYTGDVEVQPSMAGELLRAADQYLLSGLKAKCEEAIASSQLEAGKVMQLFQLAERFSAPNLARRCVLFALSNAEEVMEVHGGAAGFAALMKLMSPQMKASFESMLHSHALRPAIELQASVKEHRRFPQLSSQLEAEQAVAKWLEGCRQQPVWLAPHVRTFLQENCPGWDTESLSPSTLLPGQQGPS